MQKFEIEEMCSIRVALFSEQELESTLRLFRDSINDLHKMREVLKRTSESELGRIIRLNSVDLFESLKNVYKLDTRKLKASYYSVFRYLTRMYSRSTPNKLMSNVANFKLTSNSPHEKLIIKNRFVHLLPKISRIFNDYEEIIEGLNETSNQKLFLNNCVFTNGNFYEFCIVGENPVFKDGDKIIYNGSIFLDFIVTKLSEYRFISVKDLIDESKKLTELCNVNSNVIVSYLKKLLKERFLLLEEYPNIEILRNQKIDLNTYLETENLKEDLFLFNIDSEVEFEDHSVNLSLNNVKKLGNLLGNVTNLPTVENIQLDIYKNKIIEKYGYCVPINILELFDENIGLGSPFLINSIDIENLNKLNKFRDHVIQILNKNANRKDKVTFLTDDDILEIFNKDYNLHDFRNDICSFDLVLKPVDNEKVDYVINSVASSLFSKNFTGRFIFLDNEDINLANNIFGLNYWSSEMNVRELSAKKIKYPRKINVNKFSENKTDINFSDIRIMIDKNNKFVILDKNLNSILIDNESMINLSLENHIIRFLLELSSNAINIQNFIDVLISLADNLKLDILYKNILLAPKVYKIKDIKELTDFEKDEISVVNGDMVLKFDLKEKLDETLIDEYIKNNKSLVVTNKILNAPSNLIVDKDGNSYNSEIVFSFFNLNESRKNNVKNYNFDYSYKDKVSLFNEDFGYLYIKVYSSVGMQNTIINSIYKSFLINRLNWFMVRYKDERHHLRIRIRYTSNLSIENIFLLLNDLLKKGLIQSYNFDIYTRELERYGGKNNINDVEKIFEDDTLLVSKLLSNYHSQQYYMEIMDLKILSYLYLTIDPNLKHLNILINEKVKSKKLKSKFDLMRNKLLELEIDDELKNIANDISNEIKEILIKLENEFTFEYISDFLSSLLHMHFNRLYGDNNKEMDMRVQLMRTIKYFFYRRENNV